MPNNIVYYKERPNFYDGINDTLLVSPLSGIVNAINGFFPAALCFCMVFFSPFLSLR